MTGPMGTVDFRFPENLHVFQDEVEGNIEIQLDLLHSKTNGSLYNKTNG